MAIVRNLIQSNLMSTRDQTSIDRISIVFNENRIRSETLDVRDFATSIADRKRNNGSTDPCLAGLKTNPEPISSQTNGRSRSDIRQCGT